MMKEDPKDPDMVLHAAGWNLLQMPEDANFAITGHESQVVTLSLDIGDYCQAEPGVMMYLTSDMKQSVSCDCNSCCGRCCSGEECCWVNFTNSGSRGGPGFVALTPNFPTSKVVPVDLSSPHVNGTLICQQGSFMASYGDVQIGISLDFNFMRCCCAGLGLVRQRLQGQGTAFLSATGTIVQHILKEGETILVDTNCIMAFADTCKLDLKRAGGFLGMAGGGEGIFNTSLTGPGLVIVQSMNEVVFREALIAPKIYRR